LPREEHPHQVMPQEFEAWLAQVGAEDADFVPADLPAPWRAWTRRVFQERGAVSAKALKALATIDRDREATALVERARALVPAIVADCRAVGMELDIQLRLDEWGLPKVLLRYEPDRGYLSTGGGGAWVIDTDAELLAAVGEQVQEDSMEEHVFVWPVCPEHQLGGHADALDEQAVWICNAAGGHVIARIGELSQPTYR
jgi:hypothetical protein